MKKNLRLFLLTVLGMWMAGSAWAEDHYLVGGSTASGWNAGEFDRSPVAMVNVSENVWVWAGTMTVGDIDNDNGRFKIPSSAGGWDGYWAPSQNTYLTADWSDLSTNSSGDNKFRVSEEGVYRITINTNTKKIKAEKMTEPSKDGEFYLISSVNDYYWYAGKVTSTGDALKARLTADLDFAETGFFPLACDKYKFKGVFDGGGHIMKNMVIIGENKNLGLTRYATGGTNIHDLVIEGSFTGSVKVGGFVGFARDGGEITLTNVINKVDVTATGGSSGNEGNAAGLVGCAVDGTKITATNCANMGEVKGQSGQCAAFIGWSQTGTTFTNCWNSGTINNIESTAQLYRNSGAVTATNCYDLTTVGNQGEKLATDDMANGKLCFKLNGKKSTSVSWYQVIGTDAYPMPFGSAIVYANGELRCDDEPIDGKTTFANTDEGHSIGTHEWDTDWGFCTLCDELKTDFMSPATDGYYEIGTKEQLNWFAVRVNGHKSIAGIRDLNARLIADIDFSAQDIMIGGDGNGVAYKGTFDGQGHKVTLGYAANAHNAALFRTIAGANIKNLVTDGTISNEGGNCAGGIFAGSHGASVVENCVSYVALSRTANGDATFGGIGAYMHDNGTIKNCAFYGSIDTPYASGNGGLLGYANGGSSITIENCIVAHTKYNNSGTSADYSRNDPTITNCHKVASDATELASGELAFIINRDSKSGTAWYQKLGTDAEPAPLPFADDNKVVYGNGTFYCDGMPKSITYENVEKTATTEDHNYDMEWGLCTNSHDGIVCDDANPDFATQDGGYYEIGSKQKLNWFALFVNQGKGDNANAKLTADIDMDGITAFPGIGTNDHRYRGIFDGQKHRISNLNMNYPSEDGVGFFRYVTSGGTVIKRFTIDSSCEFKGNTGVGAFVGRAQGRNDDRSLTFEELGNEANVTANGANGGGILGVDMLSDAIITIKNCYNAGTITSGNEGGGFSGWLGDKTKVINCYNIGAVTNGEGLARANGDKEAALNLFANVSTSGLTISGEQKADEDFSNGTVFTALFDYTNDTYGVNGNVWRMEFDASGNPTHPVLYDVALVLDENFPNRFVDQENATLTLKRTTVAGYWNTICVPFELTPAQIETVFGAGATVATLDGYSGDTMLFRSIPSTETMVNGVPYLVKPTQAITSVELTGMELLPYAPKGIEAGEGLEFTGIFEPTLIADGDLFVAAGNKLQPSDGNGKLKGFRAYFKNTSSNPARVMNFVVDGGETTGIIAVDGTVIENGSAYTLGGQRVAQPTKGLYIVNGKKIVVK